MKFKKALIFSIVVTLAAQTLDIMTHLATNVTVHLPYVSVKSFVIAFTLFFVGWWISTNWKVGIFAALTASVMFYIYYRFTEPTLDRTIFTLDEDMIWILIHAVAIYIPYLLTLKLLEKHE